MDAATPWQHLVEWFDEIKLMSFIWNGGLMALRWRDDRGVRELAVVCMRLQSIDKNI